MLRQFEALTQRLANRPDTEPGQAFFRLLIGSLAVVILLLHWEAISERGDGPAVMAGICAFYIVSFAILAHIFYGPVVCPPRRFIGITTDIIFITIALMLGREPSMQGLVMIYLWVIVGNGIRFGQRYLLYAFALSVGAFSFVLRYNEFWHAHQMLGWGIFIGQILVVLYMRALVIKLQRARDHAKASSVQSIFVARMSREMRTPLNTALEGLDSVMNKAPLPDEQQQMLDHARKALLHLQGLVDDVLDLGEIAKAKLKLEIGEIDLRELLLKTVAVLEPQARAKGVGIDIHMEAGVPSRVYGDALRLGQILLNLGGNAIKFTNSGYVRLEVYVVERNAKDDRVAIRFAVRDTGSGIAANKIELAFESFEQADEDSTREYGGAGLGLTITKSLVQLMGGTIRVESEEGTGSVFSFVLRLQLATAEKPANPIWAAVGLSLYEADELAPMLRGWGISTERFTDLASLSMQTDKHYAGVFAKSRLKNELLAAQWFCEARALPLVMATHSTELLRDPDLIARGILAWPVDRYDLFHTLTTGPMATEEKPSEAPTETSPLRVLIVDDTERTLTITAAIVAREGYAVDTTTSAARALDACALEQFDVLICDRNMPNMNGMTLVSELRKIEAVGGGRTAVIMLTGDTTEEARRAAMAVGVDTFVTKPIRPTELAAAIKNLGLKTTIPQPIAPEPLQTSALTRDDTIVVDEETVTELTAIKPDNPHFVVQLQADLLNDCYGYLETISRASIVHDYAQIREIAHALYGAASSVGLVCIARACEDFNRGGSDGSGDIQTRTAEFERRLKLAIVAVENYLSDKTATPK